MSKKSKTTRRPPIVKKSKIRVVSGETAAAIAAVPKSAPTKPARDHETPSAKEVANDAANAAFAKGEAAATAEAKDKKISGLNAAAQVLAKAQKPLSAKEIAERAIELGWKTDGKTPEATLYAAMTREIAAKGNDSRFKKVGPGAFEVSGGGK